MKPEVLLQISARLTQFLPSDITYNVWSETVNMDATNQKEATMITVTNNEQAISPKKDTSPRSTDIVIEVTKNEAEFTTIVNKKKKKEKIANKLKPTSDPIRPSPYKKI
ncbi:5422_t:CDS:2 [Gigaspora margarita]|uniref:5422_t:CDS:1 n=1 Tax=Gigaspora margarita TaxID=4874 RepID=A0ABN7UE98_GIGMA|nr:5422_t:CDS:2 [Gigaspora margarita]